MATLWLIRRGEKTTSPLTIAQLNSAPRNGQVKPGDQIAKAGTEKWQAAEKVQGLELAPIASAGEIIEAKPTPATRGSAGSARRGSRAGSSTRRGAPVLHRNRNAGLVRAAVAPGDGGILALFAESAPQTTLASCCKS